MSHLFGASSVTGKKLKVLSCSSAPRRYQLSASCEVFPCTCRYGLKHKYLGNALETPLYEILHSDAFLNEKKARMSCDLNIVPQSCISCENRAYRQLREELQNMREIIYLKKPLKTMVSRLYGIAVVLFERITRSSQDLRTL